MAPIPQPWEAENIGQRFVDMQLLVAGNGRVVQLDNYGRLGAYEMGIDLHHFMKSIEVLFTAVQILIHQAEPRIRFTISKMVKHCVQDS